MRDIDPAAIRSRLGEIEGSSRQERVTAASNLAGRLLADDEALTDFAAGHPGAPSDIAHINKEFADAAA